MKKKNTPAACCPCNDCDKCAVQKEKVDPEVRIYNVLNTVEKISVKLAQINQILKKAKKKKFKKLGKVDKKTGTLILKGQKKAKKAKSLARYKAAKKKKK